MAVEKRIDISLSSPVSNGVYLPRFRKGQITWRISGGLRPIKSLLLHEKNFLPMLKIPAQFELTGLQCLAGLKETLINAIKL